MILVLIDIVISVRIRKRALIRPVNHSHAQNHVHHRRHIQMQMFILMTSSTFIFLMTTLPIAVYKILSPRQTDISMAIFTIVSIWAGLGWFQTLNYAVNISFII